MLLYSGTPLKWTPLGNTVLAVIQRWPLLRDSSFGTCVRGRYIAVGHSSGVAVKRGSTVYPIQLLSNEMT